MTARLKQDVPDDLPRERPPKRTAFGEVVLDGPATMEELDRLPRTWRGEIIHDTLLWSWISRAGGKESERRTMTGNHPPRPRPRPAAIDR